MLSDFVAVPTPSPNPLSQQPQTSQTTSTPATTEANKPVRSRTIQSENSTVASTKPVPSEYHPLYHSSTIDHNHHQSSYHHSSQTSQQKYQLPPVVDQEYQGQNDHQLERENQPHTFVNPDAEARNNLCVGMVADPVVQGNDVTLRA